LWAAAQASSGVAGVAVALTKSTSADRLAETIGDDARKS
jgi:hypothetical protein